MSKERNSTPPQKPSGQTTNNPGGNGKVRGQVPTMRNPPPPPTKKN
jgi:hypothetical protein